MIFFNFSRLLQFLTPRLKAKNILSETFSLKEEKNFNNRQSNMFLFLI